MREKELAAFLQQYKGRPLKLMEVCALTHLRYTAPGCGNCCRKTLRLCPVRVVLCA